MSVPASAKKSSRSSSFKVVFETQALPPSRSPVLFQNSLSEKTISTKMVAATRRARRCARRTAPPRSRSAPSRLREIPALSLSLSRHTHTHLFRCAPVSSWRERDGFSSCFCAARLTREVERDCERGGERVEARGDLERACETHLSGKATGLTLKFSAVSPNYNSLLILPTSQKL